MKIVGLRAAIFLMVSLTIRILWNVPFSECNLSNANIVNTIFKEVSFEHCKMMGMKFEDCNDFLMDFNFLDCTLNYSSFYGLELKRLRLVDSRLLGADFTDCNLTQAEFIRCNLENAIFENTNLSQADFSTSLNIILDPERNDLYHCQFSLENLPGLLGKYKIKVIS
ncbi:pentapeptide repeat-containing protein [Maribacter litopenaei]|uniref:Pentapeptide repeat-containing protein n=1 Tax=Maribacter litopenaei TaxID=2976127 RepID=A0ABY5YBJ2_9FLAO|nr:pentapeptide repeat-containing protein [Maribacter litopenaei]UWX55261.1 pentapeptide repeat-containing protein [Maribacter litopenaei]